MKHKHHIIPKHMGGTDDPSNIIELSVKEHSQAHLVLYEQYGKKEDLCAHYMLSGRNQDPEFVRLRAQLAAASTHKTRISSGFTGSELFYGREVTDDEVKENSQKGGQIQGKINSESGHMKEIQKLSDVVENGRKGGKAVIASGKGSFGDPIQRLKAASQGGKVQGKRNANSGHLKRIAQLPNDRNKGMFWITNETDSKMIKHGDTIEDGWRKGRVQKTKV
jgi:hypothetical protein